MHKEDRKKTGLGLNKRISLLVAACIVIFGVVGLVLWRSNGAQIVTLRTGSTSYRLSVVTSTSEQEKGLGGRPSLPLDQGMLFSFSGSASRCFWMKDMEFPLDIIWLSSSKKVVYIQPDAQPSSYPGIFCPSLPAQYVIELNGGQTGLKHIRVGQTLEF
jgi:uncharacterized membrane protein (UPF0127 family)